MDRQHWKTSKQHILICHSRIVKVVCLVIAIRNEMFPVSFCVGLSAALLAGKPHSPRKKYLRLDEEAIVVPSRLIKISSCPPPTDTSLNECVGSSKFYINLCNNAFWQDIEELNL